jgi:hypothetical protein
MLTTLGVLCFYAAVANAVFASAAETCTQDSADSLYGGFLSAILYLASLTIFLTRPLPRAGWIALVPALLALGNQVYFSLRLFIGYYAFAASACDVITGDPSHGFDGREPFFATWWFGMSAFVGGGLIWSWVRTRDSTDQTAATGAG